MKKPCNERVRGILERYRADFDGVEVEEASDFLDQNETTEAAVNIVCELVDQDVVADQDEVESLLSCFGDPELYETYPDLLPAINALRKR